MISDILIVVVIINFNNVIITCVTTFRDRHYLHRHGKHPAGRLVQLPQRSLSPRNSALRFSLLLAKNSIIYCIVATCLCCFNAPLCCFFVLLYLMLPLICICKFTLPPVPATLSQPWSPSMTKAGKERKNNSKSVFPSSFFLIHIFPSSRHALILKKIRQRKLPYSILTSHFPPLPHTSDLLLSL